MHFVVVLFQSLVHGPILGTPKMEEFANKMRKTVISRVLNFDKAKAVSLWWHKNWSTESPAG